VFLSFLTLYVRLVEYHQMFRPESFEDPVYSVINTACGIYRPYRIGPKSPVSCGFAGVSWANVIGV
jgi:hypothetical protein